MSYSSRSIHAEEAAMDKIQPNRKGKIINVSLLVIRITPASTVDSYKLANSRPCIACMYRIKNLVYNGYRVTKVYFSNEEGEIISYRLRDIVAEKQHHLTKYYRVSGIPKKYIDEFDLEIYMESGG